jgi:hypothetical protein
MVMERFKYIKILSETSHIVVVGESKVIHVSSLTSGRPDGQILWDSAQIAHGFLSITAVGNFSRPSLVVNNFGCNAEWRVDSHPRFLADATGDGFQEIIGFGSRSVLISFSNRDGTFQPPKSAVPNTVATVQAVGKHPRFLADLTGGWKVDIIGFGNYGVHVSLNNGKWDVWTRPYSSEYCLTIKRARGGQASLLRCEHYG